MNTVDLTDHFLVAMPTLMDPNFHRTLTYICEHSEQGAMGIVINRPLDIPVSEIMSQMSIKPVSEASEQPAYYGGPVDTGRGFVLHTPIGGWEATLAVTERIGVTSSRDILLSLADRGEPTRAIVALGYAGWGAGQLESELTQNAWLTCRASEAIMFELDCDARLDAAAAEIGIDLALLSSDAGHA